MNVIYDDLGKEIKIFRMDNLIIVNNLYAKEFEQFLEDLRLVKLTNPDLFVELFIAIGL